MVPGLPISLLRTLWLVLSLIGLVSCAGSQNLVEDPYGCQTPDLTGAERANCGVHLYDVIDEIIAGTCSYEGGSARTREDGGGIAFSANGFRFVDVFGNYGENHPKLAPNTYTLTNVIEGSELPRENVLVYRFNSEGFVAEVDRFENRGAGFEIWCSSQSTYTLQN